MKLRTSISGFCVLLAQSVDATPTQEDVFKSINDSVGSSVDGTRFLAGLLAVIAVVIVLVIISNRRQRQVAPRSLNNHAKLLREALRSVDLRASEVKQLKILAEDEQVSSPLTLLLCPSVLARAVKNRTDRKAAIDRNALLSIARKIRQIDV
jgi:hypothetical protein